MGRPITLSNGEMHVGLNTHGMVHDFYYPYVGFENHAAAKNLQHRIGLWVDGQFSWLDDGSWVIDHSYHDNVLISRSIASHSGLGIRLEFDDFVDSDQSAFIRNVEIINQRDAARSVVLYFHQVFVISNDHYADTVQYLPTDKAILHYKGNRAFVINGQHAGSKGFDQFSVGLYGVEGHEGTFRDAEDGHLSGNLVEHGSSVDSVIGFEMRLAVHDSERVCYWIAAGKSQREALVINQRILSDGPLHRLMATSTSWHAWLATAQHAVDKLPNNLKQPFVRSLLLLKSQIDKRGAVIASTDTTMLNYSRDSYAYAWPRDGAYAVWPLVRLGYRDEPLAFFNFCRRTMHAGGYLMHKYTADGGLGSSWHPYHAKGNSVTAPIQSDETAIVLFVFAHYYQLHKDEKLLRDYYPTLVAPMANFLAGFISHSTRLPQPSFDLWERLYETTTYTTAVTYGALVEAARLAEAYGADEDATRWRTMADDIHDNANSLFDETTGNFIKGFREDGTVDTTVDISSVFGAYMFGLFDVHSDQVRRALENCVSVLTTSDRHPGLARFANDEYDRRDPSHVGNPWFIATLWRAQYALETNDRALAEKLVQWVTDSMLPTGVLSEQIDPDSRAFVSVSPLTWSQAEYVATLLDMIGSPLHADDTP